MILGLFGSITRAQTAMFPIKSFSDVQEVPPFTDFQTPPATAPIYTVFGSVG